MSSNELVLSDHFTINELDPICGHSHMIKFNTGGANLIPLGHNDIFTRGTSVHLDDNGRFLMKVMAGCCSFGWEQKTDIMLRKTQRFASTKAVSSSAATTLDLTQSATVHTKGAGFGSTSSA